jgi:hypothetical protein
MGNKLASMHSMKSPYWGRQINRAALLAALSIVTALACSNRCNAGCKRVPLSTETRYGGNQLIQIDLRDEPIARPTGIVMLTEAPVGGALLQVFRRKHDDPLWVPRDQQKTSAIAACITRPDGVFSFSLDPGEYEIRASLNGGMDVTSTFLIVKSGWRRSNRIVVEMHVGT